MSQLLTAVLYAFIVAAIMNLLPGCAGPVVEASCHTDTECMEFCPLADGDCDGGPQS